MTEENTQKVEREPRRGRWRRVAVPVVIGLASILLLVSVLATWVNRVALDNETYTDTSAQLLQHPEVRRALEELSGRLSAADMRAMNYAADVEHRDIAAIVRDFLAS